MSPEPQYRVLVVEDEESFVEALTLGLSREGFRVDVARDGAEALELVDDVRPDVVLLDLMLPKVSGLDVCRQIRARSSVPIIMVTAHDSEVDAVVGLEVGADDYVTKPYRLRELVARMRAVLRRAGAVTDDGPSGGEAIEVGDVRLDPERHEVLVRGVEVSLPLREFELLELLLTNAGRVLTRDILIDRIWGPNYVGDTKTLDVHIKRLRSRIEDDPSQPRRITTIRGLGYRYEKTLRADLSPDREGISVTETRRVFHEELQELGDDVIRLSAMASESIQAGTAALLEFDLVAAERVIVNDVVMDELTHDMEERIYLMLARQQPMAVDLRTLMATLRVIHELERTGDLMINVAKATRRLYPNQLEPRVRGLIDRIREQATSQLQVATDAFAERDPDRAKALADMDDVMDDLQKELFRTIFSSPANDEASVQRAVQVALVGRYFERIADHSVNVAERVWYMVTGHLYHQDEDEKPGD